MTIAKLLHPGRGSNDANNYPFGDGGILGAKREACLANLCGGGCGGHGECFASGRIYTPVASLKSAYTPTKSARRTFRTATKAGAAGRDAPTTATTTVVVLVVLHRLMHAHITAAPEPASVSARVLPAAR